MALQELASTANNICQVSCGAKVMAAILRINAEISHPHQLIKGASPIAITQSGCTILYLIEFLRIIDPRKLPSDR